MIAESVYFLFLLFLVYPQPDVMCRQLLLSRRLRNWQKAAGTMMLRPPLLQPSAGHAVLPRLNSEICLRYPCLQSRRVMSAVHVESSRLKCMMLIMCPLKGHGT